MKGCQRCDAGWVEVTQSYVDRIAPIPELQLGADPDVHEAIVAEVMTRRASLANTVYPCRDCQPAAFYRWAGGHLERNHDRAKCDECSELDARSSSRGRGGRHRDLLHDGPTPPVPTAPPRADLDF